MYVKITVRVVHVLFDSYQSHEHEDVVLKVVAMETLHLGVGNHHHLQVVRLTAAVDDPARRRVTLTVHVALSSTMW